MRLILCGVILLCLAACGSAGSNLPEGNAESGEVLVKQGVAGVPTCVSCHSIAPGVNIVGPHFQGIADVAGTRVEGESAQQYLYNSIVKPGDYVVDGYSNLMFNQYGLKLNNQQIADIIAYLLTLTEEE